MAEGHQSGCHSWHSCPSDADPPTYECGDTGHSNYCITPYTSPIILGNENATITLIQYGDYFEMFSQRYYDNTFPQIKEKYVDTNLINLKWVDFGLSIIIPQQNNAANAALCAAEYSQYWEYHDKLFEIEGKPTPEIYLQIATELFSNTNNWEKCFDEKKYDEHTSSSKIGYDGEPITGVPTFFVYNSTHFEKIRGALPLEHFENIIDKMLG